MLKEKEDEQRLKTSQLSRDAHRSLAHKLAQKVANNQEVKENNMNQSNQEYRPSHKKH